MEKLPPGAFGCNAKSTLLVWQRCPPQGLTNRYEGETELPDPQLSSLHFEPTLQEPPFLNWLRLCQTEREFLGLAHDLRGIPKGWIEWVENIATATSSRGIHIKQELTYRLNLLWSGIILLQEMKFLCDAFENALRHAVVRFSTTHEVTFGDIERTIPDLESIRRIAKDRYSLVSLDPAPVSFEALGWFTLYQLTDTVARNWISLPSRGGKAEGFITLFYEFKACRDVNKFKRDMEELRKARNAIAHSHRLFQPHECIHLFDLAQHWTEPLHIDLQRSIEHYRKRRPRFLDDLGRTFQ